MATDGSDRLELLRDALEAAGYADLLVGLAPLDEPRESTFERLAAPLQDAVVPAMRARAAAMRLLAELEFRDERFEGARPPDRGSVRVPLDHFEAERLDGLAEELDRAVAGLRLSRDAD